MGGLCPREATSLEGVVPDYGSNKAVENALPQSTRTGDDSSSIPGTQDGVHSSVASGIKPPPPRLVLDCVSDTAPEPDAIGLKREKLRVCAPVASEVLPYLFVGGEMPSKDLKQLKELGVTHIINAAASILDNSFPSVRLPNHSRGWVSEMLNHCVFCSMSGECLLGEPFNS